MSVIHSIHPSNLTVVILAAGLSQRLGFAKQLIVKNHQTLLAEKGLPSEFIDVVLASTAEEVKDNIENLQAIFDSAVETRVNERLTQKAPRMGTGSVSMTKEQIMAVKDDEERLKLIAAHRNLF